MFPLLIFASVPTSKTGVLPDLLLSSRGPSWGRWRPKFSVSPSMKRDTRSKNRSTRRTGNHLSNHMDNPKVDLPSISWGKTCTCNKWKKKKSCLKMPFKKESTAKDEMINEPPPPVTYEFASSRAFLPCQLSMYMSFRIWDVMGAFHRKKMDCTAQNFGLPNNVRMPPNSKKVRNKIYSCNCCTIL